MAVAASLLVEMAVHFSTAYLREGGWDKTKSSETESPRIYTAFLISMAGRNTCVSSSPRAGGSPLGVYLQ